MGTLDSTGNELIYQMSSRKVKGQSSILYTYISGILPEVRKLLKYWQHEAELGPSSELKRQALLSLKTKDFHCQGGAVFAVPYPEKRRELLKLIVAFQTICDYLDNLCDRAGCTDGRAFEQLHRSLNDALSRGKEQAEYYKYYPHKNDNGYLEKLVHECRTHIAELPSWEKVEEHVLALVDLYANLQVNKHLMIEIREDTLKAWAASANTRYNCLFWQEYAAACGSTLAVFALMGLASRKNLGLEEVENTVKVYFPWICGLHILLDYFIDRQEDNLGGDLNFTFYYGSNEEMMKRLKLFVRQSHRSIGCLPASAFAKTVVEGLLAMYLSDRKVREQGLESAARELLAESGPPAFRTYQLCKAVRKLI